MLATAAAIALSNAGRAEERREVEERLTDADAVRAEVLATLSMEVRKPLGAVTESSRALQETFGNVDAPAIERLVASATALDVTLAAPSTCPSSSRAGWSSTTKRWTSVSWSQGC